MADQPLDLSIHKTVQTVLSEENQKVSGTIQLDSESSDDIETPWQNLPDLVLIEIFQHLPPSDRFNASLTCRRWNCIFKFPQIWRRLVLEDKVFWTKVSYRDHLRRQRRSAFNIKQFEVCIKTLSEKFGAQIETITFILTHSNEGVFRQIRQIVDLIRIFITIETNLSLYSNSTFKHLQLYKKVNCTDIPYSKLWEDSRNYYEKFFKRLESFEVINFDHSSSQFHRLFTEICCCSKKIQKLKMIHASMCYTQQYITSFENLRELHLERDRFRHTNINSQLNQMEHLKRIHIIHTAKQINTIVYEKVVEWDIWKNLVFRNPEVAIYLDYLDEINNLIMNTLGSETSDYIRLVNTIPNLETFLINGRPIRVYYGRFIYHLCNSHLSSIINTQNLVMPDSCGFRANFEFLTSIIINNRKSTTRKEDSRGHEIDI